MMDNKTTANTIDDYIANFPEDVQAILQELRATIRETAPDAEEAISYQMPTFKLKGNLVHFAAYKNHIGFYPAPQVLRHSRKSYRSIKVEKVRYSFQLTNPCHWS